MSDHYENGTILRYDVGKTALMRVTQRVEYAKDGPSRYYGDQCMGGSVGAGSDQVRLANQDDLVTWLEHNPEPLTAPSPGGVQRCKPWMVDPGDDRAPYAAMRPHEQGDWVRYGDIAGMASENARLRKALEAIDAGAMNNAVQWCEEIATEALRGAAGEVK